MNARDDDRIERLLAELDDDPDWEMRWAQEEMRWEGVTEIVAPLLSRLDAEDERTRVRAVTALGWVGDDRAVEPLVDLLDGAQPEEIHAEAATALGSIGSTDAIGPLRSAFEAASPDVRSRIVDALGKIGALDEVCGFLDADEVDVRVAAIHTLGRYCTERTTTTLLDVLEDGTTAERRAAAWSLGVCRDERAFESLLDVLDDDDPEVRMWAAQGMMNYAAWKRDHVEPVGLAEHVRRSLGRSSSPGPMDHVVAALLDRLDDDDEHVRRQSTIALGRIEHYGLYRGDRVRSALREVRENDDSAEVRTVASNELSRLEE